MTAADIIRAVRPVARAFEALKVPHWNSRTPRYSPKRFEASTTSTSS